MLHNELESWIQQLLSSLSNLPGGGNAEVIETVWRQHEKRKQPVVTVYGSYDTGKSSLLKRLLVDDDKNVPDWLTVSARRETFEVHETEAFGCTFQDTPGISGGNLEHERLAREALALSDAFLVVLPPQLLTSEREQILNLLTGQFFSTNISNAFFPSSLIIVVSRMDEAGIDPSEDESGYQELAHRKQNELRNILHANNVDTTFLKIYTLAADPYQYVGSIRQPPKSAYNEFRDWDGIDILVETLQHLPEYLLNLRGKAAVRYFSWLGERALLIVNTTKLNQEAIFEECCNWKERFLLIESQLDILINAAKLNLEGMVEEQLISVSRYGLSTVEELEEILESRFSSIFEQWTLSYDAELNKLFREAGRELKERQVRPNAKRLFEFFDSEKENENESSTCDYSHSREVLSKFGDLLNQGLKQLFELKFDMDLERAEVELKRLSSLSDVDKYLRSSIKGVKSQSEQNFNQLKQYVCIHRSFEIVTPILIELGTLILEEVQEQQLAQQRIQQRTKLREIISLEAHKIAINYFNIWKQNADNFKGWLQEQQFAYTRNQQLIEEQVNQLDQHGIALREVLFNSPV